MSRSPIEQRRPGWTLHRYLLREMVLPTLLTLVILTVVVLTEDMLRFSSLVLNRGLGAGAVASLSLYKAVPAITWMLPFAVLMGCLVTLGRLATHRELLVLEASGISPARLVPPLLLFAAILAAGDLALSVYIAPWSNRALDDRLAGLARQKPWASISPGQVHRFGDWKLQALETSPAGDRLAGVQLLIPDTRQTAFAKRASLGPGPGGGIQVELQEGTVFLDPRDHPRQIRFVSMTAELPVPEDSVTRSDTKRLAGLSIPELRGVGRVEADMELQRRFAFPVATLVFAVLAVPLIVSGQRFSRSGRSGGWVMGLCVALLYYGLAMLARGVAQGGYISPFLGTWLPNIVFGAAAVLLVLRLTRPSGFRERSERSPRRERRAQSARSRSPRQRALPRYVAGSFIQLAAACFAVVLLAHLVVDVLERLDRFARYGAAPVEVMRYYAARIPLLASRVVPMSLLVATALCVSLFAARGELVAMRSCGIPGPRALLPLLTICALIVPCYHLVNDQVIPRATVFADYVNDFEIKNYSQETRSIEVWYLEGDSFYEADLFDPGEGVARNVTVYELGPDRLPVSRTDATRARHVGAGLWRLEDHLRVEAVNGSVRSVPVEPFARLGDVAPGEVLTRHLSVDGLRSEILQLQRNGIDATHFRVDLYLRLASPFACLVLPALALFFALGGPPHPSPAATLVFSVAIAAVYLLLNGLGASLGYGRTLPPPVAGIAPTALFAAAAAYLGLRLSIFR